MKRMIISPVVFASMFVMGAVSNAQARDCSNASLRGAYGFSVGAIVAPGTPRGVLGRISFDGRGNWTNTLTINDNGTVRQVNDHGSYTVNADCTGKLFPLTGAIGTIEIVLVDGGNEFYQLRTDPSSIVFLFNVAKKQFPGDD
jgi:hypothetical protein